MKKYNRLCEFRLRDADLLFAIAYAHGLVPCAEFSQIQTNIHEAWRLLLVNQFHDVLPGSSIELAHSEAKLWFLKSLQLADEIIQKSVHCLGGTVCSLDESTSLLNTLPWEREVLVHEGSIPCSSALISSMSTQTSDIAAETLVSFGKYNFARVQQEALSTFVF